ncbi:MAG: septum formation initiator family protein [Candidatus Omnitrophica bacterium]|nr:septum formation initiator family protein [Candidatus Omnitrophota bacterium]
MEGKKIAVCAGVIVAVGAAIFLPGYSRLQKLREDREDMRTRSSLLSRHNDTLKEEIRKMEQDPGYVEKKAREKLGIVKKGEFIYKGPVEESGE